MCLKLPLAKNLEILEKRQKRKGKKYEPGGRRHCNVASKAPGHQLVSLPSPPALGTVGSVAPAALPVCTPHPGAESRLKIESELLRKGLSAQALVPCPAHGVVVQAVYSKCYFKGKVNSIIYVSTQTQVFEQ